MREFPRGPLDTQLLCCFKQRQAGRPLPLQAHSLCPQCFWGLLRRPLSHSRDEHPLYVTRQSSQRDTQDFHASSAQGNRAYYSLLCNLWKVLVLKTVFSYLKTGL